MTYRDRDAFDALVGILLGSREFARATLALSSEPDSADQWPHPLARVLPDSWSEAPDTTANQLIRSVHFRIEISVQHSEPQCRFALADRLTALAQNLIDGSTLDGTCIAGLTKLMRGRYQAGTSRPTLTVELAGRFAYRIPSLSSRNTSS
jgi:hypothetical protein